jgi:L-lactate utilization protein LutC
MSTRQEMLRRIREALGRRHDQPSTPSDLALSLPELGPIFDPIPPGELVSRFEEEFVKVGGATHRVGAKAEVGEKLSAILGTQGAEGVVLTRNPLLARLGVEQALRILGIPAWTWPAAEAQALGPEDAENYRQRCFAAAAGVTGADWVLAETGSLVLSSRSEGSQLASLAPPIHIAFYLRRQVLATLEEVLERLLVGPAAQAPGRSIVFITGTSRTADIEQILIQGVHGPCQVHATLVEECCLTG